MPDWKRVIVGDAFALDSRDPNFYRDLFLLPSFLLFSIMAVSSLLDYRHWTVDALKLCILALVVFALMRERLVMLFASLGFVCLQSGVSLLIKHQPAALIVFMLSGAGCLLLLNTFRDYEPSYTIEKGMRIISLLTVLIGGVFCYVLFRLVIHKS